MSGAFTLKRIIVSFRKLENINEIRYFVSTTSVFFYILGSFSTTRMHVLPSQCPPMKLCSGRKGYREILYSSLKLLDKLKLIHSEQPERSLYVKVTLFK